jgi:hypothetical protein
MLHDLAVAFRKDTSWRGATVPGRFYIDPVEVGLGDIEPGLGTTTIKFYCDRTVVPQPWPVLGDTLEIDGQTYEIVERDEDDIGEFGFRLIKQELGIASVTSETAYGPTPTPQEEPVERGPGRPTRREEVVTAYVNALGANEISRVSPIVEIVGVIRQRLGNGEGLSDRTLRKIVGDLVRRRG